MLEAWAKWSPIHHCCQTLPVFKRCCRAGSVMHRIKRSQAPLVQPKARSKLSGARPGVENKQMLSPCCPQAPLSQSGRVAEACAVSQFCPHPHSSFASKALGACVSLKPSKESDTFVPPWEDTDGVCSGTMLWSGLYLLADSWGLFLILCPFLSLSSWSHVPADSNWSHTHCWWLGEVYFFKSTKGKRVFPKWSYQY